MNVCIKGLGLLSLAVTGLLMTFGGSGTVVLADNPLPEPPKSVAKLDVATLAHRIDRAVQQRLDAEKMIPSRLADDAEFMRRVYLDITGVIPSADKAAAFLESKDADKRAKLIDELLADPQYGRHMADIWQAMLLPRTSDNRRLQTEPLVKWLEAGFNANKPWDKFVGDLLTSTGKQDANGAVTFFLANPTADKMTDTVARLFLGVQLQCAQCHNHPFTGWKQTEYWAMAAFFTKVRPDNTAKAAKAGATAGVTEEGRGKGQKLPESAKVVPPKFLQGVEPKMESDAPYRPVLAQWLTSAENQFFARAMVNRTWHHLFGRGFVNPVDDMHKDNEASHPELIDELTEQFVANGFDLKFLVCAICNSQAYQRTSKPTEGNEDDNALLSHMAVKVMSPEQLFDSLEAVIGKSGKGAPARPNGPRGPGNPRQQFIAFFQVDEGADPTEYQSGIPQALRLMNSPQLNKDAVLLTDAVKADTPEKVIERLYLGTVSRRPTEAELQKMSAHVKKTGEARKAYADVLWALLNCSEFALNH